jgi:hypothetical protein
MVTQFSRTAIEAIHRISFFKLFFHNIVASGHISLVFVLLQSTILNGIFGITGKIDFIRTGDIHRLAMLGGDDQDAADHVKEDFKFESDQLSLSSQFNHWTLELVSKFSGDDSRRFRRT